MNYAFLIKEFALITGIYFLGEIISKTLHLPTPGNVVGMVLMVIFLLTGLIKLEQVETASSMLLDNLALFFVPAGVGLILYVDLLRSELVAILLTTIISTLVVLIITGRLVQYFVSKYNQKGPSHE